MAFWPLCTRARSASLAEGRRGIGENALWSSPSIRRARGRTRPQSAYDAEGAMPEGPGALGLVSGRRVLSARAEDARPRSPPAWKAISISSAAADRRRGRLRRRPGAGRAPALRRSGSYRRGPGGIHQARRATGFTQSGPARSSGSPSSPCRSPRQGARAVRHAHGAIPRVSVHGARSRALRRAGKTALAGAGEALGRNATRRIMFAIGALVVLIGACAYAPGARADFLVPMGS